MDEKAKRKDTIKVILISIVLSVFLAGVTYLLFAGVTLFFGANLNLISNEKLLAFQTGTVDGFFIWLAPDMYRLIVTGATFVISFVILFLCFRRCKRS